MGSNWSSLDREPSPDLWWPQAQPHPHPDNDASGEEVAETTQGTGRGKIREDEMQAFKQELAKKRTQRHEALAALQTEMRELRRRVEEERILRTAAEEERDKLRQIVGEASAVKAADMTKLIAAEPEEISGSKENDIPNLSNEVEDSMKETIYQTNVQVSNLQAEISSEIAKVNFEKEQFKLNLEKEKLEKKRLIDERVKLLLELEEKAGLERQVQALKDVSEIGKEMLRIRELQVKELKKKLVEINMSVVMQPPEDLRTEYEKQIENIRKLRTLYEERAAATLIEHRRQLDREEAKIVVLETKLRDLQKDTEDAKEAKSELEEKLQNLESSIQHKENELETTKDDLFSSNVQNRNLNSQMMLINNLFSHMLVSPKVDFDRLARLLKENHGLITELTMKSDSNEVAALLVDLAGQVEKEIAEGKDSNTSNDTLGVDATVESKIASNLTKVWRVMLELLSHHQSPKPTDVAGGSESCYKYIQTPSGPRSVISVSQTFLTLKDLILEKNRLVKEVGRLKTLNNHLEDRLGNQEKRLSFVTTELRKTWGVVNKMKAQHKALHTHEKILRYELQQKRCMLTELKQELENCRDTWGKAREKNSQTEEDWKKLRKEFAARKLRKESNSAESGYEEEDTVQSNPIESTDGVNLLSFGPSENGQEVSEEEVEHSDGNSFDTVIDLLDITGLENQPDNSSTFPLVLSEEPSQSEETNPCLLPLSNSEFTLGLDQIESEDLAAVLDVQYQNQLLGADYNLSLPSSSGSSPIPTENDDFASSEIDISEESSSSNDNQLVNLSDSHPTESKNIPEENFLFGSNSSQNISKFFDGLFVENQPNENQQSSSNLTLSIHTPEMEQNDSATPTVSQGNCYQFPVSDKTPLVNEKGGFSFISTEPIGEDISKRKTAYFEPVYEQVIAGQTSSTEINLDDSDTQEARGINNQIIQEKKSQEDLLTAREDRFKKLEQQCRSLVSKVTSTNFRSEIISNKLDELHLSYGSSEETSDTEEEPVKKCTQDKKQEFQHDIVRMNPVYTGAIPKTTKQKKSSHTMEDEPDFSAGSSTSKSCQANAPISEKTPEEILEARAARLKRLEEQCKSLFVKMSATSSRSDSISNKLDELHETYKGLVTNNFKKTAVVRVKKSKSYDEKQSTKLNPQVANVKEPLLKEDRRDSVISKLVGESKAVLNKCSLPGPSTENIPLTPADLKITRTPEQILEARAERFKRLEEQCKSLVSKMTATSLRSEIISNKLDELHSCYGSSEDASEGEENTSFFKENRKSFTPTSSPSSIRKSVQLSDRAKATDQFLDSANDTPESEYVSERLPFREKAEKTTSGTSQPNQETVDRLKQSPEEIIQARSQRLGRMEEECKSLFSQMTSTSQRSDVMSNRLEELHEQYGQLTISSNDQISSASALSEESNSIPDTNTSGTQDILAGQEITSHDSSNDLSQDETNLLKADKKGE